jgi:predicted xylan-binding protein with Ca-dependent carbohydrate-binding module
VPAATFVDWVQVYSYTPGAGPGGSNFTSLWRDDFDFFDNGRWWTANWTFDYAVNDYVGQNANTRNGKLVLIFTDENGTGQFPTPPEDGAPPSNPPASNPPPGNPPPTASCGSSREYAAGQLTASTGAATSDGWNLWTNGTLSTNHTFSAGNTALSVRARGQAAAGQWPHMSVLVNNQVIGQATVATSSYSAYDFFYSASAGSRTVSVRFDNDYYQGGEDRNLYVASLGVDACPD